MTRRRRLGVVVALAALLAGCADSPAPEKRLRLATTTSAEESGLLPYLFEPFEKEEGVEIQRIAVGTGQAMENARRGDADIVIVHDRKREDAFVAQGWGTDRHDLMWNDFVILGPKSNPAGVRGERNAVAALQRIAAAKATFVSRGDKSGTHSRELALWEKAGVKPAWEGYLDAGQGMSNTLTLADEKNGYVLSDRGTWLKKRKTMRLEVLVEGDPALRNPYGVILVNPAKHPHVKADLARRLLEYVTSPAGQQRIAEFRVDGEAPFHPGASGE